MNLFKKSSATTTQNDELTGLNFTDKEDNLWFKDDFEEGQLLIDVYQTEEYLIIKSTIAGVRPEDIDISINNDMLTIRGKRQTQEEITEENYIYKECYWGSFSRSIILPVNVKTDKVQAYLENGVLIIKLKREKQKKKTLIKVKEA